MFGELYVGVVYGGLIFIILYTFFIYITVYSHCSNLPSSAERIRSIRVIIDLLTPGQRRALYWLTSLLRNTTEVNQEELIIKCAGQVAAGKYVGICECGFMFFIKMVMI